MTEGDILISRTIPDVGLIEFEQRVSGWRAYHFTPIGGKRKRLSSVTTILGRVTSNDALMDWYEARGAESTLTLARRGYLDHVEPAHAIDAVREAGMGAKATAREAADRGIRVHTVLEQWAMTGEVPNPSEVAETDRGYLRGLIRWLMDAKPEPVSVEQLVVHPVHGYAGRMDLRARIRGREYIVDLKTNRRAQIYPKACLQVVAYHSADVVCGADVANGGELLVAVGPDGTYAEALAPPIAADVWKAALEFDAAFQAMGNAREVPWTWPVGSPAGQPKSVPTAANGSR